MKRKKQGGLTWNLGLGGVACKEVRWRHVHSAYVNTPVAISNFAGCARRQWQRAQPSSCAFVAGSTIESGDPPRSSGRVKVATKESPEMLSMLTETFRGGDGGVTSPVVTVVDKLEAGPKPAAVDA